MLFNSFEFLIFLPIVFALYWFVFNRSLRWQNSFILIASYFFYGWWSKRFLGLLMLSTLLDYCYGFGVASQSKNKARLFLTLSIINNLGILCVFKYYDFFAQQLNALLQHIGMHSDIVMLHVVLPIGISFYTFHGMSYVFDIYRGKQKPVSNVIDYAVFVGFFPLLVAGPIERAGHLLPQVQKKRTFNYSQAVEGCRLMLWGMFKKVVIADGLAGIVDMIFHDFSSCSAATLIVGAIGFSFQIYCDFSGYSDIAIGTAKLLGVELLSNFKFPYFSRDIAEFWRRWHISLSSWFKDYLYIPLGGSKEGRLKAVRNTFIIFLVSGFWHGASWNYIVWGGIHACGFLPLLLLNRNRKHVSGVVAHNKKLPSLKEMGQMIMTFCFVTFAWIFFRADNGLHGAVSYIKQIYISAITDPRQFLQIPNGKKLFLFIIPFVLADWYLRRDERQLRAFRKPFSTLVYVILFVSVLYNLGDNNNFIYFQF